jgi:hypothetical protein
MSNSSIEKYIGEAQEYICEACDARFFYLKPQKLVCPKCGVEDEDCLIPQTVMEDLDQDS